MFLKKKFETLVWVLIKVEDNDGVLHREVHCKKIIICYQVSFLFKVYPIQHFEEQEINGASSNLLTKHQYPMERILMQVRN